MRDGTFEGLIFFWLQREGNHTMWHCFIERGQARVVSNWHSTRNCRLDLTKSELTGGETQCTTRPVWTTPSRGSLVSQVQPADLLTESTEMGPGKVCHPVRLFHTACVVHVPHSCVSIVQCVARTHLKPEKQICLWKLRGNLTNHELYACGVGHVKTLQRRLRALRKQRRCCTTQPV